MRNLLTNPAWTPDTLGLPLPPVEHAVSVSMPCWQDVVDYEEERPRVTQSLKAGYPRFFVHPRVTALFHEAERRHGRDGEGALVFPSRLAAERCGQYVTGKTTAVARIADMGVAGLHAVVFPDSVRKIAREYWRYCGETVSSRLAVHALSGTTVTAALEADGRQAKQVIRRRLADLSGVDAGDVFLFPSGMAAVAAVHRMLRRFRPGLPTVQWDFPYVDVLKVQEEFGSGVKFYPNADTAALAEIKALAGKRRISGVFCEMPSNPLLRCVPVGSLAADLRAQGIPLIIDDTIASVVNIDALRFADAVTTSLTKAFSGAGDVLAGALTINPRSPHHADWCAALREEDDLLWCEDGIVLERNSRDFPARIRRMSEHAATLAAWLERHPAVGQVYYPREDEGFEEVARPGAGRGCLLSFILKDPGAAPSVYDRLRVCKGPSLGTNFTLCCPYTLLAHYRELDWAASCGVRADLLRVSAGLEDVDELVARFAEALPKDGR